MRDTGVKFFRYEKMDQEEGEGKRKKKKVTFSDTVTINYTWSTDFSWMRNGCEWKTAAADRGRFQRRIDDISIVLDPVLRKKSRIKPPDREELSSQYDDDC